MNDPCLRCSPERRKVWTSSVSQHDRDPAVWPCPQHGPCCCSPQHSSEFGQKSLTSKDLTLPQARRLLPLQSKLSPCRPACLPSHPPRQHGVCVCWVVSESLQPCGWTIAHRLLCPWDFPDKNTRVVVISFSRDSVFGFLLFLPPQLSGCSFFSGTTLRLCLPVSPFSLVGVLSFAKPVTMCNESIFKIFIESHLDI